MPGSDDLYPPAQYGWGWMLLAIGILVLLIASAWLVVALTHPRRALPRTAEDTVPPTADVLTQLRIEYLERIGQIEVDHRERHLSAHDANLELSRTVRAFVNEYSGLEAPVLALDDLIARGVHPSLIDAMRRHYYPGVFRQEQSIDPVAGTEAARTVVRTWH